ncbi:MAG TPA: RcpC/CpaB family pilus assembly protein [Candidatus Dormibacteraeota bacterium]|nr:RcpC/CpaB family pilus assembly protein [Candidatus Dormibacteraeota bacterium]
MRRSIYLVVFIVLSGVAGLFYYSHTRQATALVASHDLAVGTRIQDSDVAVRQVNPASVGGTVLRSPDQAIGQIVSFPVLEGQFLDAREVAATRNARLLGSGLDVPSGYRIIGVPIAPAAAVGGVLKPGDRVDVMAIPNPSKLASPVDESTPAPIMIGKDVLVIGLRTDQGTAVDQADHGVNLANGKPACVLLAIPQTEETAYSAAIVAASFVLALSTN